MTIIALDIYRRRKTLLDTLAKLVTANSTERFNDYLESEIMSEGKRLYTPHEAAELLLLHPETVRRFVREGLIQAVKIGRSVRIERTELERYWRSQGGGELFADTPKENDNE